MRNIAFIISYDGTKYHGFQRQKNGETIQQAIEDALKSVCKEDITVFGCGRTDSGVHALNYLLTFKTNSTIPACKFPLAVNSYLNKSIFVKKAWDADEDFHGRFSVVKKTYVYKINCGEFNPFLRSYVWHYDYHLDIEKMQEAAKYLEGTHDFACFMASGGQVESTVRTIYDAKVEKKGDIIEISLCGNGFLYNMVRIIAGTLVYVGAGKLQCEDIEKIILSKDRTNAGITAPPQGLYMENVEF